MSQEKLKVIIAGAGIAGLSAAIALKRLPYIDVQLFEQAPELKEIGASIAISPNGLHSLEKLGVPNALDENAAFRGPSAIPMIYRHWRTNEIPSWPSARSTSGIVSSEIIHLNKKVASADASHGGVVVHFADETTAQGDILIGADGIHSKVRKSFAPNHQLFFTGKIFLRSTFDASLVADIPFLPLDSAHWWGPNENFFASRLGKNQYTTIGNFDLPNNADGKVKDVHWNYEQNIEVLRQRYKDWNPVVKALVDKTPYTRIYPNFAGETLSTWVFESRVTFVGDAAHTHGGAFAAGGSLAIDDAYALFLAVQHVLGSFRAQSPEPGEIRTALALYDETRRPHTEKLLSIVLKGVGNQAINPSSDNILFQRVKNKSNTSWLSEHDVEKAFQDVIQRKSGSREDPAQSTASNI